MTQLGKYELNKELGKGGFGTVYQAVDTLLDVERAVKVLHPVLVADATFVARFKQEAQLAARLEHPNLVPVYDFGEVDGRFYLAMKFMPGGSLMDLLTKEGKLDEETALHIFQQVAEGLSYAHSKGIIHRDLKPSNILFDQDGQVRISDLGFAKSMDGGNKSSLSTSGMMVGTPAYMAPELWRGKPASPASDIYSMGCILYEMLTGKVLFEGDSPADVMTKHVLDGPGHLELLPESTVALMTKSLSKEPADRFMNMQEFSSELQEVLSKQVPVEVVVEEIQPPELEETLPEKTSEISDKTDITPPSLQEEEQSTEVQTSEPPIIIPPIHQTVMEPPKGQPPEVKSSQNQPIGHKKRKSTMPTWVLIMLITVISYIVIIVLIRLFRPAKYVPTDSPPATAVVEASDSDKVNYSLTINAADGWVDSGINITRDQDLSIKYRSGLWSPYSGSEVDGVGVSGSSSSSDSANILNGCHHGGLIAKIGSNEPFCVNNFYNALSVDQEGRLFFSINDNAVLDNSGSIIVGIDVSEKQIIESTAALPTKTSIVTNEPSVVTQAPTGNLVSENTIEIIAGINWVSSQISVKTGDHIIIKYKSGQWNADPKNFSMTDADGYPDLEPGLYCSFCTAPLMDDTLGLLVARVEGNKTVYPIGNEGDFIAPQDGLLILMMNDLYESYVDDTGSITVQIFVYR